MSIKKLAAPALLILAALLGWLFVSDSDEKEPPCVEEVRRVPKMSATVTCPDPRHVVRPSIHEGFYTCYCSSAPAQ